MRKYLQLLHRWPDLPVVAAVRDYLWRQPGAAAPLKEDAPRIAVECIPDTVYFGMLAAAALDLGRLAGTAADLVIVRSVNAALGLSVVSEIKRSAVPSWLLMNQWRRSFGALARGVAYRSSSWTRPFADLRDLVRSFFVWRRWKSVDVQQGGSWAEQSVDGIVCGDLVIDSYLRLRPSPFFEVHDPMVWRLLWQTLRDIERARHYFRRQEPRLYLTSYSTYIEHGLAVRVALEHNVPVYSFGNFAQFGLRLTPSHTNHAANSDHYRSDFLALPADTQARCLAEAQRLLDFRMAGGIDHATAYMKQSAYAVSAPAPGQPALALDGAVVVFLHDFFDSPHIWLDLVFTEFWEWICCTIETLQQAGIPFFLKPHPNQIAASDVAVAELKRKYPQVRWLDVSVNNLRLAQGGIACGVTVFGTVAHELAYLGVPSIGAARHVHHSFDFCRTAHSRDDYKALLLDYAARPMTDAAMREQALQFFAMHNNLHRPDEAAVSAAFLRYWRASAYAVTPAQVEDTVQALHELRTLAPYAAHLRDMARSAGLASGLTHQDAIEAIR